MESSSAGGILGDLVPMAVEALEVFFCSSASSDWVAWAEQIPLVFGPSDRTTFHKLLCPPLLTVEGVCPLDPEGPNQQAETHPGTVLCSWHPPHLSCLLIPFPSCLHGASQCLSAFGLASPHHYSHCFGIISHLWAHYLCLGPFMPLAWAMWQTHYWVGTLLDLWETKVLNACAVQK